jgi:CTP:molybdopterin cytidylyltransferase MocA
VTRAAIVLAAGRGERMGGPKAWLLVERKPLLLLHVERARAAGCDPVVVVVSDERIASVVGGIAGVSVAVSREPDQAGSLAVGVRALHALAAKDESAVVITPVDALPAKATTLASLFAALDGGARAATPRHAGRGGHPIACRLDVLASYATGASPPPLRDCLTALGGGRVRVDVEDPAVGVDLDTPADVIALTGCAPSFWR